MSEQVGFISMIFQSLGDLWHESQIPLPTQHFAKSYEVS